MQLFHEVNTKHVIAKTLVVEMSRVQTKILANLSILGGTRKFSLQQIEVGIHV